VTGGRGRKLKQLLDDLKESGEFERGSNRLPLVENWFWKSSS